DRGVRDVEVDVARGHDRAVRVEDAPRRGEREDLELPPARVLHGPEGAADGLEDRAIRVVGAARLHAEDDTRRDEASERIDVAVRVVVQEAVLEPEHLLAAESVVEASLDRSLVHAGVAVQIKKTLARRQTRALAVHLDRAA